MTALLDGTMTGSPPLSLDALYALHAPQVLRWAARLGGHHVDPEDVAHDVFLTAASLLHTVGPDSNVLAWLYTLTRNATVNRSRRERLRAAWRRLWGAVPAEPAPLPLEPLERAQTRRAVHQALGRLSTRYREVLVLFELEERSGREVAELLKMKEAAVWVLLHRARAALARELEGEHHHD
ncbi:MAG: RNA polymerase sigma factor [Archangiaceae bacterium]|nr:RNA polymerase sigma factor [Archangiaceae bacterium]